MLPRVLGFLYAICDLTYATGRSVICALGLVTLVIILWQYMFMITLPITGNLLIMAPLKIYVRYAVKLTRFSSSNINFEICNPKHCTQ